MHHEYFSKISKHVPFVSHFKSHGSGGSTIQCRVVVSVKSMYVWDLYAISVEAFFQRLLTEVSDTVDLRQTISYLYRIATSINPADVT